jgi:hypothetical protein
MAQSLNRRMAQFCDQRFRLLQILRIEPFGEPVIDFGQQLVSFFRLSLLLPETSKACRSAEFPGFGLLLVGDLLREKCPARSPPQGTSS